MKLVRVRWFNWGQHHDDQGEVHSHRIRYCRCYPVGHRTAGKCDRRFPLVPDRWAIFSALQLEGTRTGTGTEQPLIGSMGTTTRCQLHRLFQFPML